MRRRQWLLTILSFLPFTTATAQVSDGFAVALATGGLSAVHALRYPRDTYAGRDEAGVPRYGRRPFGADERPLPRRRFRIEEPSRLYLPDPRPTRYLVYHNQRDTGSHPLGRV